MTKDILRSLCPPLIWTGLSHVKRSSAFARIRARHRTRNTASAGPTNQQDLSPYWDPEFAKLLDTWGEGNVWNEIEMLLVNCRGKVLDVACGTGVVMERLGALPMLEVHGIDISDFLVAKAAARGVAAQRLKVGDATRTDYATESFAYSYSIGSLEHFTEQGIDEVIVDNHRITQLAAFHFVPVSRTGRDEGWIKTTQSYFNNSPEWWLQKFRRTWPSVFVIASSWADPLSVGRWFVCLKGGSPPPHTGSRAAAERST